MLPDDLVMVALSVSTDTAAERTEGVPSFGNRTDSGVIHADTPQTDIERRLRHAVGPKSYQLWFHDRARLTVQADELVVGAVSPFVLTLLQRQFRQQIGDVASSLLGPAARIRFVVDGSLSVCEKITEVSGTALAAGVSLAKIESATPVASAIPLTIPVASAIPLAILTASAISLATPVASAIPLAIRPAVGRRFAHLADLVVGSCNQLAVAAARQVSEAPGQRQNPLYLFGGVGLGKTHLLEGIYCELRRRFPSLNVVYLTSEQFANYFTHALRTHTLPSFRQRFRGIDVLLVDDVDFFDGKRGIQEEFLHTVKTLESHGKQIVVSADRHPNLLSQTSEELTSRFVSGLVCRLEAPDLETRTKIVQHKLTRRELELTPEAVSLVAQWFKQNVRELEGALNCLEAHFALSRQRMNGTAARQILADLQRDCVQIVRLSDVERAICDLFRLVPDELRSASRARNVSQPRMLAMFLARKLTQAAYSEIGEFFGGRNHSTVISAERQVRTWMTDETKITIASRQWSLGELVQTLEQQLLAS